MRPFSVRSKLPHIKTFESNMSKEGKHHFIPSFYSRKWTSKSDGMLHEFSLPNNRFRSRRVNPDGTGYQGGLYSVSDYPAGQTQYIETGFLNRHDGYASRALNAMLAAPIEIDRLPLRQKVAWASFLYTLQIRAPETLISHQKLFDEEISRLAAAAARGENVHVPPSTLKAAELIPLIASSRLIIRRLVEMRWIGISTQSASYSLLTSDRPYAMSNGFERPDAHIAIPLSPSLLFFATPQPKMLDWVQSLKVDELVTLVNNKVCEQAVRFVYGVDDSQLRFVQKRFGRRIAASPFS